MKKSDNRAIFKTALLALAIFTLSACNNLHTKQELADEAGMDKQLVAEQISHRDSTNWHIEGCPWYGCTQGAREDGL